jgi:legumain
MYNIDDNYLFFCLQAIMKMHSEKRFKKLLFYLEACESGSMFKNLLPDNIDVYATTASNGSTR